MTDSTPIAIDVRGIAKRYGNGESAVTALDNVSLSIRQNEFFTLLGPSGCGKTTLLRLIAGFNHPSEGEILLHGRDIAQLPPNKRPVNTVFQSYALFPHMTVGENIAFGLQMLRKPKAEIEARVAEMLKLVRMEKLSARRTSQISGGQAQRVALARALAPMPQVLLLDEPLSALDYKLRKEMQIDLKRLQHETGITFIFVTHDQEEALAMSDRIAVMSAGKMLQVGSPREIYDRPANRFVADFIGESNFLAATVIRRDSSSALVRLQCGAEVLATLPDSFQPADDVSIVVRPEHASLGKQGEGLAATVENVVYLGTDTHIQLRLSDGTAFTVRQQNERNEQTSIQPGADASIIIANGSAQILRDAV